MPKGFAKVERPWPEGVSEDLQDLAAMWATSLKARGRSPATIGGYLWAVRVLFGYLTEQGMPQDPRHIKREHVEKLLADLRERGSHGGPGEALAKTYSAGGASRGMPRPQGGAAPRARSRSDAPNRAVVDCWQWCERRRG